MHSNINSERFSKKLIFFWGDAPRTRLTHTLTTHQFTVGSSESSTLDHATTRATHLSYSHLTQNTAFQFFSHFRLFPFGFFNPERLQEQCKNTHTRAHTSPHSPILTLFCTSRLSFTKINKERLLAPPPLLRPCPHRLPGVLPSKGGLHLGRRPLQRRRRPPQQRSRHLQRRPLPQRRLRGR